MIVLDKWPDFLASIKPKKPVPDLFIPATIMEPFTELNGPAALAPLMLVKYLGTSTFSAYPQCRNLPSQDHLYSADIYDQRTCYYWADFDIFNGNGMTIPIRLNLNHGDGDANDGMWGEVWNRMNRELIADLHMTDDSRSTITAIPEYLARFQDHPLEMPVKNPDQYSMMNTISIGNDAQLEKILYMAYGILWEKFRGNR